MNEIKYFHIFTLEHIKCVILWTNKGQEGLFWKKKIGSESHVYFVMKIFDIFNKVRFV